MGEEGMRIGFDPDKYFGELPGWDVIDVDHDATRMSVICHDPDTLYRPDALCFPLPDEQLFAVERTEAAS